MTTSPNKFLATLRGEPISPPPIWLMRQAGRYLPEYQEVRRQAAGFLDLCFNPDRAAEVTLQPIRRFGFDAAILFSDILVVPHALGQPVDFLEGEGPKLDPIRSEEGVRALALGKVEAAVSPVWRTVENVRSELPDDVALIGFAGAPWTVATYMVEGGGTKDFATVKAFALAEPDLFQDMIDRVVEATILYLAGQISSGAQAIKIFDSWAGAVPADRFGAWVIEPTRRIVAAIKQRYPTIPIIGFPRGAGVLYHRYVDALGIDAVAVDPSVPIDQMRMLQDGLPVQGNLDPAFLMAGGEIQANAVNSLLSGLADRPFVFNLGHGINRLTPPEHVAELVEQVRAWQG